MDLDSFFGITQSSSYSGGTYKGGGTGASLTIITTIVLIAALSLFLYYFGVFDDSGNNDTSNQQQPVTEGYTMPPRFSAKYIEEGMDDETNLYTNEDYETFSIQALAAKSKSHNIVSDNPAPDLLTEQPPYESFVNEDYQDLEYDEFSAHILH